jgi:phosphatidate cytidylyltransferase
MADPLKPATPIQPPDMPAAKVSRVGKDLWPRVVSGVVLAVLVIGLTLAGPLPFSGLLLGIGAILAWEWGRIVRGVELDIIMAAHISAVVASIALVSMDLLVPAVLALIIGAILVTLLSFGRNPALSAVGVAYAGLPAVALIWFRNDPRLGLEAVLFILICVVVTDVAAYFSGRLIGGPKIWPRVSPNKTWAGLIGAIIASSLAGAAFAAFVPGAQAVKLGLIAAALAVVAQVGDFAESALKRKFGAKDASNIIPGHGGFMDRVDGLVMAAVFAAIYAAVVNIQAPARALLQ